jgi:regulatory protein
MGKITALHVSKGRGRRVNVFLDGRFAFSVGAGMAAMEGLRPEQDLSAEQIETLVKRDRYERCLAAATRYLAYRPRSHSEMRERLQQRGFESDTQQAVIERLKGQGLLDDAVFASFWKDNRESFSPRSRRMTRIELERKGVARDIIDQAVNGIDDEASAYRAASSHARSLRRADHEEFCRRLGAYLKRRGFAYDVVEPTVEKVWRETESGEANSKT